MTQAVEDALSLTSTETARQPYENYVDSRIEWLGRVPAHWAVAPVYSRFEVKLGKMLDSKVVTGEYLAPYLRNVDVQWDQVRTTDLPRMDFPPESRERYLLRNGDLLVCEGGEVGRTAVWRGELDECYYQKAIHRLRPFDGSSLPRFLYYAMRLAASRGVFVAEANPNTIYHLTAEMLRRHRFPFPPLPEQRAIAAFLDRETARIDSLIAKKKRLIELLQEKRQALISHAVTKGLNSDAPMKDSGIEWFGQVPAHWTVTRLSRVTDEINDINHEMPPAVDDGVPFLSAKDLLDDGSLNFTDDVKQISEVDFERLSRKVQPRHSDIIYSRIGACLGKARIVETNERFLISYSCCVIRLKHGVANPMFFRYLLDGELMLTEARMRTQGIGVPDLGLREIAHFPVALPPSDEQEAIAKKLELELTTLGRLQKRVELGINHLCEYRTSLISAAVTGKIDIRGEVDIEEEVATA